MVEKPIRQELLSYRTSLAKTESTNTQQTNTHKKSSKNNIDFYIHIIYMCYIMEEALPAFNDTGLMRVKTWKSRKNAVEKKKKLFLTTGRPSFSFSVSFQISSCLWASAGLLAFCGHGGFQRYSATKKSFTPRDQRTKNLFIVRQ